ncbi:MAG: colanic acid biosynthesis glycosyltransferase WcaI, partial [Novosphingobium sp.]|nr:colanic acid biosynthesis glycosyltransferase WcaI [Novosphingobium sp.]
MAESFGGSPNILIIGLNYAPEAVGIGPFTQGMAEGLAGSGFAVEAVVGKPYYPQWRAVPGFAGGGWARSTENGVRIVRCPHFIPRDPTGSKRIVHLASFAVSALGPAIR